MTSITLRKILVAAAAVSALSMAACSKPAENTTSNVVENTTVVETAPADANAVPADANTVTTTNTTMTTNTTTK